MSFYEFAPRLARHELRMLHLLRRTSWLDEYLLDEHTALWNPARRRALLNRFCRDGLIEIRSRTIKANWMRGGLDWVSEYRSTKLGRVVLRAWEKAGFDVD